MYRLSIIINEIYNKYLPLAEKENIKLNLDFIDTTQEITDPELIKTELNRYLDAALKHINRGEISITVKKDAIIIKDTDTILSKPLCRAMTKGRVKIKSRVGFGTMINISLKSNQTNQQQNFKPNNSF